MRARSSGSGLTLPHAASVAAKAKRLSPVPGGAGPVATALLLAHTVQAAED